MQMIQKVERYNNHDVARVCVAPWQFASGLLWCVKSIVRKNALHYSFGCSVLLRVIVLYVKSHISSLILFSVIFAIYIINIVYRFRVIRCGTHHIMVRVPRSRMLLSIKCTMLHHTCTNVGGSSMRTQWACCTPPAAGATLSFWSYLLLLFWISCAWLHWFVSPLCRDDERSTSVACMQRGSAPCSGPRSRQNWFSVDNSKEYV
jgi:hypothetical protein